MEASLARRIGPSLPAVGIGLALLAGLWFMPDLTPGEAIPVVGQESLHGRITESLGITEPWRVPLLGIVAAVPLTTFVAALLMVPGNSGTNATS